LLVAVVAVVVEVVVVLGSGLFGRMSRPQASSIARSCIDSLVRVHRPRSAYGFLVRAEILELKKLIDDAVHRLGVNIEWDPSSPRELVDYIGVAALTGVRWGLAGAAIGLAAIGPEWLHSPIWIRVEAGEGTGLDEGVEVGGDLLGEAGVVVEQAGLDVALLASLGEVGGGEEDAAAIDEDDLGVLAGPTGRIRVEGARVVEELREAVSGPEAAAEAVEEAGAELVLAALVVARAALDVDDEADVEGGVVAHTLGEGAPEVAGAHGGGVAFGAIEGEIGDEDGGCGLAAEVADDDCRVA
jgi:hypothetical protein